MGSSGKESAVLLEVSDDGIDALIDGLAVGVEVEFGGEWGFVGGVQSREVEAFAIGDGCSRFFIEAFGVSLFADFEGGVDEDFDELVGGEELADGVAVGSEGGDEGGDGHDAGGEEEFGDFADAADVFGAVGVGESEVFVEAMADVVAVEDEGEVVVLDEGGFEGHGDGGFSAAGEAGEPEYGGVDAGEGLALVGCDLGGVPGDVGGFGVVLHRWVMVQGGAGGFH
jgi:hypothetical protein